MGKHRSSMSHEEAFSLIIITSFENDWDHDQEAVRRFGEKPFLLWLLLESGWGGWCWRCPHSLVSPGWVQLELRRMTGGEAKCCEVMRIEIVLLGN